MTANPITLCPYCFNPKHNRLMCRCPCHSMRDQTGTLVSPRDGATPDEVRDYLLATSRVALVADKAGK